VLHTHHQAVASAFLIFFAVVSRDRHRSAFV
jgi:hypothetical protein